MAERFLADRLLAGRLLAGRLLADSLSADRIRILANSLLANRLLADRPLADKLLAYWLLADRLLADKLLAKRFGPKGFGPKGLGQKGFGPTQIFDQCGLLDISLFIQCVCQMSTGRMILLFGGESWHHDNKFHLHLKQRRMVERMTGKFRLPSLKINATYKTDFWQEFAKFRIKNFV